MSDAFDVVLLDVGGASTMEVLSDIDAVQAQLVEFFRSYFFDGTAVVIDPTPL